MNGNEANSPARYHHGDLRNALLEAGRGLLEEGGPTALSIREIARRVGVSAPAAYHHFSGLDEIAVALAERGFAELADSLQAAPSNAKGQLAPAGMAYVAFARQNPGLYRLMFGEGFHTAFAGHDGIRTLRLAAYEVIKSGLSKRMQADEVDTAALFLWSLTHGLALLMIDGQFDAGTDPEKLVASVLRLSGKGLPTSAEPGGDMRRL
ncbi:MULTISPECIES: TetR/AcrR family transcriptional regulator [unclassified Rhizobium]|uniref:TetR/AcrR family transcriptional regulator n=1 Tax=unclassified Rhizobium TaxID=2613769 RepID=UPI0006479353|nr:MULTISPECIES: TetR/AcrR family transcriptional regulator [unclassified Rhizobium]MBN8949753.1 TetR/AcrR family transcriptional regulator [Rhizobium tropici]OJY62849.1 MAG: TetR family transcriptional regulator [Rhizobium sp. 60-20]RKD74911.1 TetR family transcriptional regulator [Rhizobium sp. WW_1]